MFSFFSVQAKDPETDPHQPGRPGASRRSSSAWSGGIRTLWRYLTVAEVWILLGCRQDMRLRTCMRRSGSLFPPLTEGTGTPRCLRHSVRLGHVAGPGVWSLNPNKTTKTSSCALVSADRCVTWLIHRTGVLNSWLRWCSVDETVSICLVLSSQSAAWNSHLNRAATESTTRSRTRPWANKRGTRRERHTWRESCRQTKTPCQPVNGLRH